MKCNSGKILRKSYTRKTKNGTIVHVPSSCIRKTSIYLTKPKSTMKTRLRGVKTERRTLKKCPQGFIKRNAYMRYTKSGKHSLVSESCIRDLGNPGKGLSTPGIGPLRHGELSKYGYSKVQDLTIKDRHTALDKAVSEFGGLGVWKKLNAIAVYLKRTAPHASNIFKEDMEYIRKKYGLKAF